VDVQERKVDRVHLEEVEPVQRRVPDERCAPRPLVGAGHRLLDQAHSTPPGTAKRSTRRSSAARRR
jgi:hypothetical protein